MQIAFKQKKKKTVQTKRNSYFELRNLSRVLFG